VGPGGAADGVRVAYPAESGQYPIIEDGEQCLVAVEEFLAAH
jgi:hypothetical protein